MSKFGEEGISIAETGPNLPFAPGKTQAVRAKEMDLKERKV